MEITGWIDGNEVARRLESCRAMRFSFLGNYAHLIHDVIAPIRLIEQTLEEEPAVAGKRVHVIMDSKTPPLAKKVLDFAGIPSVCTDGVVSANLVSITQALNLTLLPSLARQPLEKWASPAPERVFVSRRGTRSIENEQAVTEFLASEGFERVYMEDLEIGEQWATLAHAREIVGIHGAGLSNTEFSTHADRGEEPRFRLVELFSPGFSSTCFRDYAAVLGGHWVGVRGRITPNVVRDLDINDLPRAHENPCFTIDIERLREAITFVRSDT